VTVHQWRIRAMRDSEIDVTITCSGGTYIRALARDLGRLTGSAAHVSMLRRVRSGPFDVRDAATLDVIQSDQRPPVQRLRVVAE
jgi:tRNA pseudouridine55 synthase